MTRKHIGRIKVIEFAGVTEFGLDGVYHYVSILGYNIKPEYRNRRSTFNIIYLTSEGLNIDIGRWNASHLLIDTKPDIYTQKLIIDGIDEIG